MKLKFWKRGSTESIEEKVTDKDKLVDNVRELIRNYRRYDLRTEVDRHTHEDVLEALKILCKEYHFDYTISYTIPLPDGSNAIHGYRFGFPWKGSKILDSTRAYFKIGDTEYLGMKCHVDESPHNIPLRTGTVLEELYPQNKILHPTEKNV